MRQQRGLVESFVEPRVCLVCAAQREESQLAAFFVEQSGSMSQVGSQSEADDGLRLRNARSAGPFAVVGITVGISAPVNDNTGRARRVETSL